MAFVSVCISTTAFIISVVALLYKLNCVVG